MNDLMVQPSPRTAEFLRAPTPTAYKGASGAAIRSHYDVPSEFYALWLDRNMMYSCAMWEKPGTLEDAQVRKIDYHIEQSQAAGKARVLDIGCGWGGTLRRLSDVAGIGSAVGLTLSPAQAAWIGKDPRSNVDVRVEGWADHEPAGPYGAIISIGALEHFARPELSDDEMVQAYREFFLKCSRWLEPGGRLSLQTMAYGTATRDKINPFILEHIFPESDLPTLSAIVRAFNGVFEIERLRNDRMDYAETYRQYGRRLRARRGEAVDLVGDDVVRRFETYCGLFILGFHTGAMDLLRLTLRKL